MAVGGVSTRRLQRGERVSMCGKFAINKDGEWRPLGRGRQAAVQQKGAPAARQVRGNKAPRRRRVLPQRAEELDLQTSLMDRRLSLLRAQMARTRATNEMIAQSNAEMMGGPSDAELTTAQIEQRALGDALLGGVHQRKAPKSSYSPPQKRTMLSSLVRRAMTEAQPQRSLNASGAQFSIQAAALQPQPEPESQPAPVVPSPSVASSSSQQASPKTSLSASPLSVASPVARKPAELLRGMPGRVAAEFDGFTMEDFASLTREDCIDIAGRARGILLFRRIERMRRSPAPNATRASASASASASSPASVSRSPVRFDESAAFYPCQVFSGERKGYAFYNGPRGLGYYRDSHGVADDVQLQRMRQKSALENWGVAAAWRRQGRRLGPRRGWGGKFARWRI